MNDPRQLRKIPLKYRLGEVTLGSVAFTLSVQHQDFVATEPRQAAQLLPTVFDAVDAAGWFFPSLPVEGYIPRFRLAGGKIRYVPKQYERYFIDLRLDQDAYLKTFSSKTRATLRRKVRKFAELSGGEIDLREYRTPLEMDTFYTLARPLSAKTYQERLLDAGLPAGEGFRRKMLEDAERGSVRAFLLFCGGKAAAYLYTPQRDGVFDYQFLGYDPELARWSPGTVLQWLVLEKLFAEGGHKLFDFSAGQGDHKRLFASGSKACADVFFFKPTPRNLLLVSTHSVLDAGSDLLAKGLDKLGLKRHIKKAIRKLGR